MFPSRPMSTSATLFALLVGALASTAVAGLLGAHGIGLTASLSSAPRVDTVVVLGIVLLGALVATWFACHLALGAGCLLAATLGRRWLAGERFVAARGPALVRRAVAAGLSISVGLGGVAATAQEPALELGWSTVAPGLAATVVESPPELGWTPTPPADPPVPTDRSPDVPHHEADAPDEPEPAAERDSGAEPDPGAGQDHERPGHPRGTPDDDASPGAADRAAPDERDEPVRARRHVVVPGDTLWSLTRGWLDDPDDAAVAAAWPALYDANRDVVGPDPDLIHPGQELTVPTFFEELP